MSAPLSRLGPWVVFFVAAVIYLPALGGDYVFDDRKALLEHPVVMGEAVLWETFVREFWGQRVDEGWSSSYRPITTLTFAIEQRLTPAPWLHLAVNILFYAVTCALVTRAARRVASPAGALAAGLAFALLPIHVENVASIVGRADTLAVLACLVAYELTVIPAHGWRWVACVFGATLAYAVGLLSKETVALFPAVLAWLGGLAVLHERPRPWAKLLPAITTGLVGLAYLGARARLEALSLGLPDNFVPGQNQLDGLSGWPRLLGNLAALGHYVEITLVPLRLCVEHTYADIVPPTSLWGAGAAHAWLGFFLIFLALLDGVRAVRDRRGGYGMAALLAYALVGHWVIPLVVIVAERLALWPTAWLAIALAPALGRLLSGPSRRYFIAGGSVVLALMTTRVVVRSLDWRNNETLIGSSLRMCPATVHTRVQRAHQAKEAGRAKEAAWHFAVAAAARQRFPAPFDVPALEAERTMPLEERLLAIPELLEVEHPTGFLVGLRNYLASQGAHAEAAVVERVLQARATLQRRVP